MSWPFPPRPEPAPLPLAETPRLVKMLMPIVGYAETGYVFIGYELAGWGDEEDEDSEAELHSAGRQHLGDFMALHGKDPDAALSVIVLAQDGAQRRVVIDILPFNGQDRLF